MPRNSELPRKTPRADWLPRPWPRLSAAAGGAAPGGGLKAAAGRAGSLMQIRGGPFLRPPAGGRGTCFGGGGLLRWGSGLGYIFCYLFIFSKILPPPPSFCWGLPWGLRPSNPIIPHSSPSSYLHQAPALILIPPFPLFSHPYPQLQQPRVGETEPHLFKTKILAFTSQRLSGTSLQC